MAIIAIFKLRILIPFFIHVFAFSVQILYSYFLHLKSGHKIMIRKCDENDFQTIYSIINDAASAYKGFIPTDCWKEPYMPQNYLQHEIDKGVIFWGYEEDGELLGVMGIQNIKDVTLVRHAYVQTACRNKGIGSKLISFLQNQTDRPTLVGTWKAAVWAIHFYEKHGFKLVSEKEKDRLLKKYWSIPTRQIETSVVLVDQKWLNYIAKGKQ
jgi:N-acetylglutamate synthase-like GNAT family acetyltransferase